MLLRRVLVAAMSVSLLGSALVAVGAAPAQAAWPGTNGSLVFVCRLPGTGFTGQDICRVSPDGTGLVALTSTPASAEQTPEVSPDGSKIAYVRTDGSADRVWVMGIDGSNPTQVTTVSSTGPAWTPDGKISYRARTGDTTWEFQVVAATGGTPTKLRDATGQDFPPRWAANGSYVFTTLVPTSPGATTFTSQVFSVVGGVERQITSNASTSNNQPDLSPDGSTVVYQRQTGISTELYTVPVLGGTETPLTSTTGVGETWPRWSPDGTRLVWMQTDATHDFFNQVLAVAKADATDPVVVPVPATSFRYSGFPAWAQAGGVVPPVVASFTATAPSKVRAAKKLAVTLRCTGDVACVVTYGAKLVVPVKKKKATFTVAPRTVTMRPRSTLVVPFVVPKAAKGKVRAALAAGRVPRWTTAIVARRTGGVEIRRLTLRTAVTR